MITYTDFDIKYLSIKGKDICETVNILQCMKCAHNNIKYHIVGY